MFAQWFAARDRYSESTGETSILYRELACAQSKYDSVQEMNARVEDLAKEEIAEGQRLLLPMMHRKRQGDNPHKPADKERSRYKVDRDGHQRVHDEKGNIDNTGNEQRENTRRGNHNGP